MLSEKHRQESRLTAEIGPLQTLPGAGLMSRPMMLLPPGFLRRHVNLPVAGGPHPHTYYSATGKNPLFQDGLLRHPRGGGGRIAMSLKHFEVTFSFAGIVQVQAEDETDAIRQIQEKAGDFLMTRLDPEKFMIHSADEVDVGGQS